MLYDMTFCIQQFSPFFLKYDKFLNIISVEVVDFKFTICCYMIQL